MSITIYLSGALCPDTPALDVPATGTVDSLYSAAGQLLRVDADGLELSFDGCVLSDRKKPLSAVGVCDSDNVEVGLTQRCAARAKAVELGLEWDGYYSLLHSIIMSDSMAATDEEKAGLAQLLMDCEGDTTIGLGIAAAAEKGLLLVTQTLLPWYRFEDEAQSHCETPLFCAAANGHYDVVEALILAGADLTRRCRSHCGTSEMPLHAASRNGHLQVVKLLVAHGAPLNEEDIEYSGYYSRRGDSPLCLAYWNKHRAVVSTLLELGADVNRSSILHWAIEDNADRTLIEHLLRKGADPNRRNATERTAVHYAAASGNLPILELLLDHSGNPEEVTSMRERNAELNAMHLAAANGHSAVVAELVSKGMDINCAGRDGVTALHLATEGGHVAVLEYLLQQGADPDRKCTQGQVGRYGCTAAYIAAESGLTEAIHILARHGADLALGNEYGLAPAKRAAECGHYTTSAAIRDYTLDTRNIGC